MLQKLHIQNYAIIDEIVIQFSPKLNIITGETGAGKSILMGALSLILGERADTSVLLKNDKKCSIEGVFAVADKAEVQAFLQREELDNADAELIVRREISSSGKSRSFINDTPVSLQQLKELAAQLVDLHQQFDTLSLSDSIFQRNVLDALANNQLPLQQYQTCYKNLVQCRKQLAALEQQKQQFNNETDYNKYLLEELQTLQLSPNELEELEEELKLLSNSEGIKSCLQKLYNQLEETEFPIVQSLKQLYNQLQAYQALHAQIPAITERLLSAQIELQDIASEVDRLNNTLHFDEKRIEIINERLSVGYKLLKKHQVLTTNELLEIQENLAAKMQLVLNIDATIAAKEAAVAAMETEAQQKATFITTQRAQQIAPLQEKVNHLLTQVGMPNARFKVQLKPTDLYLYGAEEVTFLFDANKSNRFEPIAKVASGGELSRLMLCIKSLVAQCMDMPTMIFDEIDTGISGEAAKQVGLIMKDLAQNRQIICITHQPQMAGKADAHFFVYKNATAEVVTTNIRQLTQQERIVAIAQMLSGEKPTAAALENAKEMLEH